MQWKRLKKLMTDEGTTRYGNFWLKNGLLYLKTLRFGQEFHRFWLPPEQRKEVFHGSATSLWLAIWVKLTHWGKLGNYWPKIDRAVTCYARACKSCQTRKPDWGRKKVSRRLHKWADCSNELVSKFLALLCFTAEVTWQVFALLRLSHQMSVPYQQQANGLGLSRKSKSHPRIDLSAYVVIDP